MVNQRQPYQGVRNIVMFNWPYFLLALVSFIGCLLLSLISDAFLIIGIAIFISTSLSLLSSYWIYDRSNLYTLPWLNLENLTDKKIFNIHSGFNELESILPKGLNFTTLDFYDSKQHTEKSIQRARKRFPSTSSVAIKTNNIPYSNASADAIILFLSAHEIRQSNERYIFFKELHRILKPNGRIYITEHLRDLPNFLAYNIGSFHFHSQPTWENCFLKTGFQIDRHQKTTPFVSTYTLCKT